MSSKPARKKLTVALAFFVCAFLLLACAPRESYTNKPPRSTDHTINELAEKACKLAGKKVRFASQKEEALARVHRIVILNGDSLGQLEQIFATMNVAKWDISNDADMLVYRYSPIARREGGEWTVGGPITARTTSVVVKRLRGTNTDELLERLHLQVAPMYQDYRTLRRISLRDDFIAVACAPEEGRFFATLISLIDNSPADKVALVRVYDVLEVNDKKVREALASVAMILHPSKFQTADTYGVAWFSVQRKLIVTVDSMEQLKTVSMVLESIGAVESLSSKQAALEARSIHQRGKMSGDRASHSEIARISLRHEGASSSCP